MFTVHLAKPATRLWAKLLSGSRSFTIPSRTFTSKPAPVDLVYDKLVPPDGNETETPLVIMHGLLYVLILLDYSDD